jgi:acetyltransferase-like isoleucine patch superfamily enzyme
MPDHTVATRLGALIDSVRQAASILWQWEAKLKGVQFQGTIVFQGRPFISVARGAKIVLGDGVRIASARRANPLGLAQPSVLRALAPQAQLVLGQGVGLSGAVLCAGNSIEIGQQTILGAGAMVLDTDMHAPVGDFDWRVEFVANSRPVKIGRGVFIGARAIILKGATIGDRALIGAGAVVTGDVPAGHLAVGNPARILRPRPGTGHAP